MKLQTPENENYAAVVVALKILFLLKAVTMSLARLYLAFKRLSAKTPKGDLGIVFPAESQLSDQFGELITSSATQTSTKTSPPKDI
jgi:Tfp pilus assembly protein PilX